ncbi:MAG TPA: DmsE family decaheme c-type cytochrome [Usitatibacter sp.]|nr:DmsE family decaheme c-type cytochrome [Usitatibacter sp.]
MTGIRHILQGLAAAAGVLLFAHAGPAWSVEAGKDIVLRGDAKCTRCHDEGDEYPVLAIGQTRHGVKADGRTPTCTSCHGESERHINKPAEATERPKPDVTFRGKNLPEAAARNDACLNCHKGNARTMWHGSRHETEGVACANCHTVHKPRDPVLTKITQPDVCFACHKTERAQANRISHHPILEGKVVCSECHNPHGSPAPKLLVKNTVNETCWQCHAEKRGPFLWEHPSASDDCMNCHTPHGSTNPPLLRARAPYLCQECHGDGAPHPGNVYSASSLPGGAVANVNNTGGTSGNNQLGVVNPVTGARVTQNNPPAQLAFKGCVNCHQQIHGSNNPAGNRFLR